MSRHNLAALSPWPEPPEDPPEFLSRAVAAAAVPQKPRLADQLLTRGDLGNLPAPEPLIDDTIDRRTVAVLAGYWGTAKSFIVQDWAACIATGKPWQGRAVAQGRVLYVAAEGAHGLNQRVEAWEYAWRHTIADDHLAVLPVPINLLAAATVDEVAVLATGRDLVVIDTLARCMPGADENSARDMGIAVDALYRIRAATGHGTVLAVHHAGKVNVTIRGSSALESGADTVYTTELDGAQITLARTKRKDGPTPDRHQLQLKPTLHSAVIMSAKGVDMTDSEDRLMSAFMSAFSSTGASKAELRGVAGMPSASFSRALNLLISRGILHNHGTDKRPFYRTTGDQ